VSPLRNGDDNHDIRDNSYLQARSLQTRMITLGKRNNDVDDHERAVSRRRISEDAVININRQRYVSEVNNGGLGAESTSGVVDGDRLWQHNIQQQQDQIRSDGLKRRLHLSESYRRNSRAQMESDGERDGILTRELGSDRRSQGSVFSGSACMTDFVQANSERITAAEIRDKFSLQPSIFDTSLNRRSLSDYGIANASVTRVEDRVVVSHDHRCTSEVQSRSSCDSVVTHFRAENQTTI